MNSERAIAKAGKRIGLGVVQTIQPPAPPERESHAVILDLDVGTTRPIRFDEMDNRLLEMRWIKNTAFFSLVKESALDRFRSHPA